MKLHDCEAIEIEIWKYQGSLKKSLECQERSEKVSGNNKKMMRKWWETTLKLYGNNRKNCTQTVKKMNCRVISLWYAWYMYEICQKYGWYLLWICARDLPDICLRSYNWYMSDMSLRYVCNMPDLCLQLAWDLP